MKYLVLGCGENAIGTAIASRLLKEEGARVYITDQNLNNVDEAFRKLKKAYCGGDLRWFLPGGCGLDVEKQKDLLPQFFRDFDIIISALPANLNPIIAETAISAKTHYCDLGGVLNTTKKIIHWDISQRAKECGVAIVPDCGLQPGLGNIIAVDILKRFDPDVPVESITIYVGGLPLKYDSPPYYKKLFNLNGLAELYYKSPLVLHKGRPLKIRCFSHFEKIPTSEFDLFFGEQEGSVKFEAAVTGGLGILPYILQGQVTVLREKTLRFPGHYNRVKAIPPENFETIFTHWLEGFQVPKKDFTILKIVAEGKMHPDFDMKKTGGRIRVEKLMHVSSDENWTSMQKSTGFTTAVLASLIAHDKASPGAAPPEIALDPELVLGALKKDFVIYERVTPLPPLT